MAQEFTADFEQFMLQNVATSHTLLGELVQVYFDRRMITKQRAEMPLFPGKDWGTYEVRDSETGVFDGGWAQILVIDRYDWERHSHFRCAFSNTMSFLSELFAAKPLVMLVSARQQESRFADRRSFYELSVNDGLSETEWRDTVSRVFVSRPEWLQNCPQWVVKAFVGLDG
jgi:hypothetical protein